MRENGPEKVEASVDRLPFVSPMFEGRAVLQARRGMSEEGPVKISCDSDPYFRSYCEKTIEKSRKKAFLRLRRAGARLRVVGRSGRFAGTKRAV